MTATFHLPSAVDHSSRSLTSLSTHRLIAMQAECVAWREDMLEFEMGVVSPAARILWSCLCAGEIPIVVEAERKIAAELSARIAGRRTVAA